MEPDRRRQIARELAATLDAIPPDIAGPGDFDLHDLVTAMKLEAALIGECTDAMERGHAVQKVLDAALVLLDGGWRHVTRAELRGDEAEAFSRAFRNPAIADK
jgi:hypothetical protein